jgi:hypothetical protein
LDLDQPVGAALVACREEDRQLKQANLVRAQNRYDRAAAIWEQEIDPHGLALARYRQAEFWWQKGDATAACSALQESWRLLERAPSAHEQDRHVVRQALDMVDTIQTDPWPHWRWQHYDDAFRISVLFHP